ncbi:tetratricopeptide repeat protein [Catellatospora methionotrophica]|uniref:tetratricopeptide repeat protein n=1 Tax=Catellatospora methionotrophica TaxID=121620 RepID=UPI0033C71A83
MYDVFICWCWADGRAAAEQLHAALEAAGLRVFRDETQGEVFEPLSPSVERALAASRVLVAVVTARFADSPHCRDEVCTALQATYDLGEDSRRVMAVTRGVDPDEVRPRELTGWRLPADGYPIDDLVSRIAGRVAEATLPFGAAPARPDPAWYPAEVPAEQPLHGRAAEAWEIHDRLLSRGKNSSRSHPAVTIRGPGGIGKTALALQYARWFHRDHPGGVFLLRLGGSAGGRLTSTALRARFDEQVALVAGRLGTEPGLLPGVLDGLGSRYLWIVDDLPAGADPDLAAAMCAPTRLGSTLFSSRGRFTSSEVPLRPLDDRYAVPVLTGHRPPNGASDARAARDTANLLGGHPLGLSVAAGLTTLPGFVDYAKLYRELTETEPDRLLAVAPLLGSDTSARSARPLAAALLRSFDSVSSSAREMLCAASILAPATIAGSLLVGSVRRAGGLGTFDPDEGLAAAVERGLLERVGGGGYLMHAVTARAIRAWVHPPSRRTRLRDGALAELIAAVETTRGAYVHRRVLPLLAHVRAVAGLMAGGDVWGVGQDERHLLHEAGRVQVEAGETGTALATFQLLDDACAGNDADPHTRHVVRMALAVAYEAEGHDELALRWKAEAFQALADRLPPNDPDVLTALGNVAVARYRMGDYATAYRITREVYVARRGHEKLGRVHPDTLTALANLAIVRARWGRDEHERARGVRVAHRLWTTVAATWRRVAGPDDPRALDARHGLALSLRALGRQQEALAVADEVYARRSTVLGTGHPDCLDALENRSVIAFELHGPTGDAFVQVAAGRLATRPGHPTTRRSMANLIRAEREDVGRHPDRLPLSMGTEAPLPGEPDVVGVRLDGEHASAEADLLLAAIHLQERQVVAYGPDDPRTMVATAVLAYAMALADQLDGQLHAAQALADDAADGLAEVSPHSPQAAMAELVRSWISARLEED